MDGLERHDRRAESFQAHLVANAFSMTRVRFANSCDLDWMLSQLKEFDKFFGSQKRLFPEDEELALGIMTNMVMTQPVFVAEGHSGLMGFIAGTLTPHYLNPSIRVLNEVFWWVDPRYRGSSAGARLLQAFLAYGRLKADWIIMTLETRSSIDPASLEKKGFRLYEKNFLLEVAPS